MVVEDTTEQNKFHNLLFGYSDSLNQVLNSMETVIEGLKRTNNEKDGLSLLDVKNYEMTAYLSEITVLLSKMLKGELISEDQAVKRALKHRVIMEKVRPIEDKIKPQIDRLISKSKGYKGKNQHRMRLDNMDLNGDDNKNLEETEDTNDTQEDKKYVPPKIRAVHYEDEHDQHDKKLEKAKRRAMQSSLIMELKNQYSEAPEEIREISERKYQYDKEKEDYEEEYFTRVRRSRQEIRKSERLGKSETLDDLLSYGDYMVREEDGRPNKRKNSSKDSKGGKRRKKTQSERKKSARARKEGKKRAIRRKQ